LVLADYKLHGFTGIDVLTIAREQHPDLPFIVVTGALGDELAIETIKRRVDNGQTLGVTKSDPLSRHDVLWPAGEERAHVCDRSLH